MALNAGSAFLDIVPRLAAGFGRRISENLDPESEGAGESAGKKLAGKLAGAVAAAGIGVAIGASLLEGLDIQAGNDKLAAQLGLTAQVAEQAGAAASNLYKGAWGDSMEDVNEAIGAVGSTLLDMNSTSQADLEATTAKAMNLATAFDMDVNEAVNSTGILMKTGLAKDANEAFDLITAGLQGVPSAVRGDILDATDEYSTYFKNLGLTGAQSMGILKEASKGGAIQIDKTGDALKELTIRATDMSATSVQAYKDLGLNADEMAKKFAMGGASSGEALKQVAGEILKISDPVKQSNTAIGIFGTQLEDIGRENMPGFLRGLAGTTDGMQGFEGAADRMGETLNGNAKTNLESFKRTALMGMTEVLGGTVIPALTSFSGVLLNTLGPAIDKAVMYAKALIGAFMNGDVTSDGFVGKLEMVGVAARNLLGAISPVVGFLQDNFKPILITIGIVLLALLPHFIAVAAAAVISAATTAGAWVVTQAAAVAALFVHSASVVSMVAGWVLMGAQALLGAARVALAWLIALGPIGLVIAAVVAVVALIIANWDTISRVTGELWTKVQEWTGAAWEWVKNAIGVALEFVKNLFLNWTGPGLIIKHWDSIKEKGGAAFDWIKEKIGSFISFFTELPGKLAAAGGDMFDFAKQSFKTAINWIIDKWNGFSLKVPEVDLGPLGKIGGFQLDTPDIPRFAKGGIGRGVFMAGENGPEIVDTGSTSARIRSYEDTMDELKGNGRKQVVEKHYHYHNEAELRDPLVDQFRDMERLQRPV